MKENRLTLKFKIEREDYLAYNFVIADRTYGPRKKRTTAFGVVEAVAAVGVLIFAAVSGLMSNWIFPVFGGVLLLMGLYSALFYPLIFPAQLKKAANRQYDQNPYLQNEVSVRFTENSFIEGSQETKNEVFYEEIKTIGDSERFYLLILKNRRTLILPKRELTEETREQLEAVLAQIADTTEAERVVM